MKFLISKLIIFICSQIPDDEHFSEFYNEMSQIILEQIQYFQLKLKNLKEELKDKKFKNKKQNTIRRLPDNNSSGEEVIILDPKQVSKPKIAKIEESYNLTKPIKIGQLKNNSLQNQTDELSEAEHEEFSDKDDDEFKVRITQRKLRENKLLNNRNTRTLPKKQNVAEMLENFDLEEQNNFTYENCFKQNKDGAFICMICAKAIMKKNHCFYHWLRYHSQESFKCLECWYVFSNLKELFTHCYVFHNEKHKIEKNQKEINCELCSRIFRQRSSYRTHLLKGHIDQLQEELEQFNLDYQEFKEQKNRNNQRIEKDDKQQQIQ